MTFLLVLALSLEIGCGPPTVRPASYKDSEVPCPGGRSAWVLEILDRRADREGETRMSAAIREGIQKSFPGCLWPAAGPAGQDTITIEVHRFASRQDDSQSWEAAVEWSVSVQNAEGRRLTDFQANEEVSRPNYRGTDNEKESLSQAFHRALERTVKGLQLMSASAAALSPREDDPNAVGFAGPELASALNGWNRGSCPAASLESGRFRPMEWKSQCRALEDI